MSLATDIRTRAEEALDRTTTTVNGLVGELKNINVNDVTSRARSIFASVPSVDVQKLASTVEGYRKAAQEQVDDLLHRDPRVGKLADAVEGYNTFVLQQYKDAFDQVRQDPRVAKVVETVDEKIVKPARARFVAAEQAAQDTVENLEEKQLELADAEAPVQVKAAPAKPARKAPAKKATPNA
jgi:hypothetical protein